MRRNHSHIRPRLGCGSVHVYTAALDAITHETVSALLSTEDRIRAQFRLGVDRLRFEARHAALRLVASAYVGDETASSKLRTRYGSPPRCPGIELSLAHSGNLALVAAAASPVGIDIEQIDALPEGEVRDIAEFILNPRELAELPQSPPGALRLPVLRAWSRKEAWLKAHGQGLGEVPMAEIDLIENARGTSANATPPENAETVWWADLAAPEGFVAAIALRQPITSITYRPIPTRTKERVHD